MLHSATSGRRVSLVGQHVERRRTEKGAGQVSDVDRYVCTFCGGPADAELTVHMTPLSDRAKAIAERGGFEVMNSTCFDCLVEQRGEVEKTLQALANEPRSKGKAS